MELDTPQTIFELGQYCQFCAMSFFDFDLPGFERHAELFFVPSAEGEVSRHIIKQMAAQRQSVLWFSSVINKVESPKAVFLCLTTIATNIREQWSTIASGKRTALKRMFFDLSFEYELRGEAISQQVNSILVRILFEDWPQNWPLFLNDLFERAKESKDHTVTALRILGMLSVEVRTAMATSERKRELVTAIHNKFQMISGFLRVVSTSFPDISVQRLALECLSDYLSWLDLKFVCFGAVAEELFGKTLRIEALRRDSLKCILAVISHESLTASPVMHNLLDRFLAFVSSDMGMLMKEEWMDMFVAVLSKFMCLDRCALMPNDTLVQWMIEYTRFLNDELFNDVIEMWLYLAITTMTDGNSLPFSAEYLVPLQAVLCQRMAHPEEFGGEEGLFEKMGNTLKWLMKVRHGEIVHMLIDGVRREQFDESALPLFFSIGAICGTCNVEEEEALLSAAFESLVRWSSCEGGSVMVRSLYLFLMSMNVRYLSRHRNLFDLTIEKFMESLQTDDFSAKHVAVSAFRRLAHSRLFTETRFSMKVVEDIESFLGMLPPDLHAKFYDGLIMIAKLCQNQQQRHAVVLSLFKHCSSLEILTQLFPIIDESFQAPVEELMQSILQGIDSVPDRHPYYVLFEAFLTALPGTNLQRDLLDCFIRHREDCDALNCINVMVKSGNKELIPVVCQTVIEPVYQILSSDFTEFPDLRLSFFNLLKVILLDLGALDFHTFSVFFGYLFYGLRHHQREISEASLNGITSILAAVSENTNEEFVLGFYDAFYWSILRDLITVTTDGLHQALFSVLTHAIHHMLSLVSTGKVAFIKRDDLVSSVFELLVRLFPAVNQEELRMTAFDVVGGATNCEKLRVVLNDLIVSAERAEDDPIFELGKISEQIEIEYMSEIREDEAALYSGDSDLAEY